MPFIDPLNMPNGKPKAIRLAIDGLFFDGNHHKQWFLEKILEALDVDIEKLRQEAQADDNEWSPSMPP